MVVWSGGEERRGSKGDGGGTNPMVILAYMPHGVGFGTLRAILCERGVKGRGKVW